MLIQEAPNTNLFYNLTMIPMIKKTLEPGEHLVVCCVYGDQSGDAAEALKSCPSVSIEGGEVIIETENGKKVLPLSF